jgi:hypothetical protein
MPTRYNNVDAICERRGRFWKVKFMPASMMGTTIDGSEEVSKIRYAKGFCEFRYTRKWTMAILTPIFKSLIPD